MAPSPSAYGDSCAGFYDQIYPSVPAGMVRALLDLADGGPVLELGLATGRIALPLGAAGLTVHGIDSSLKMLAQFRQQPRCGLVHAVAGDICSLPYRCQFRLVICLVSTLGLLPSRQMQLLCLREVARVLQPNGIFLCETFDEIAADSPGKQSHRIDTPHGTRDYCVSYLPTPPEVLDQLALAAGLTRCCHWGSWAKTPYQTGRGHCIGLYRRNGS